MALVQDTFSSASPAFPTCHQDDDCIRPVLINQMCRLFTFLQSAVETFLASGATVWNDLPTRVTSMPSLVIFRQHFTTFLFSALILTLIFYLLTRSPCLLHLRGPSSNSVI